MAYKKVLGKPAFRHNDIIVTLPSQCPITGLSVLVLAALALIQFWSLLMHLCRCRYQRWPKGVYPGYRHGRPRWNCRCLPRAWLRSGCWGCLWAGRWKICLSLSLTPSTPHFPWCAAFQMNNCIFLPRCSCYMVTTPPISVNIIIIIDIQGFF